MRLARLLRRIGRRPPGRKASPAPLPDEPDDDDELERSVFEGDITISLPALRRWPRSRLFGVTWSVRLTDGD